MRIHESRTIVSLATLVLYSTTAVAAQSVQPTVFEETGEFQSRHLNEISGVATSRSQPGVFWSHNDSGDSERVYATSIAGALLGVFRVRGADARDWEDIALGPCPNEMDADHCLYIADTGDNSASRRRGTIYIVPEPEVPEELGSVEIRTDRAHELRVRYPDGPQDVEALAVTPEGTVLLVTKGTRGPILLYSIPSDKTHERSVAAALVDTIPIRPARRFGNLVTAAAVSPSGQLLVVRTYTELYFFRPEADGSWEVTGSPCWIGLRQPQGEAVDFIDESVVVLASESAMGRNGGLARVVCPLEIGDTPQNDHLTPFSRPPLAETRPRR